MGAQRVDPPGFAPGPASLQPAALLIELRIHGADGGSRTRAETLGESRATATPRPLVNGGAGDCTRSRGSLLIA